MTLASDFMNEVLTSAGMDTVADTDFSNKGSKAYRVYVATKLAIKKITRTCIDWGWNEPDQTAVITVGLNTVTLPSTINPRIIHDILLTNVSMGLDRKPLHSTTFDKFITNINPFRSSPTAQGRPKRYLIHNNLVIFDPYSDNTYTLTFVGQKLPQVWNAEASASTPLVVTSEVEEVLHEMVLWRFLRMEKSIEYKDLREEVEGAKNKSSLLYQLIHENKLVEKRKHRRMKIGYNLRPENNL